MVEVARSSITVPPAALKSLEIREDLLPSAADGQSTHPGRVAIAAFVIRFGTVLYKAARESGLPDAGEFAHLIPVILL